MVDSLSMRSKDFADRSEMYLVYDVQGDAQNGHAIKAYDFDAGSFRFCLPTQFILPLNGYGVVSGFPTSLFVAYNASLKPNRNCSFGRRSGDLGHVSDAYYTIAIKDVGQAEAFDTAIRQSLHLRVFCYLSAEAIDKGHAGPYKSTTKAFGAGWPLVCLAARNEGYRSENTPILFALDFTSGDAVFESALPTSAP